MKDHLQVVSRTLTGSFSVPAASVALLAIILSLVPRIALAQTFDLVGVWDTTAVVKSGPNTGDTFLGWINFSSGGASLAGTFQATVAGVPISGSFSGTQDSGVIKGAGTTITPREYQLTVTATMASDGISFHGSWTDSDGRSGDYHGMRISEQLPEAGKSHWKFLLAASVFFSMAFVARSLRSRLV